MIDISQWHAVIGTFTQARVIQHVTVQTSIDALGECEWDNNRFFLCSDLLCYDIPLYVPLLNSVCLIILSHIDNSLVVIIMCYESPFCLTFKETTKVTLNVVFIFL